MVIKRNRFSKIRRKKSFVNAKFISKQKTDIYNKYIFSNDFINAPKHYLQEMRLTNFILKLKYGIVLKSMYNNPAYKHPLLKHIYYFRYKFKKK